MITSRQLIRLIEWLRAKGVPEEEILKCVEYINQ